jgi:hypothetical protein
VNAEPCDFRRANLQNLTQLFRVSVSFFFEGFSYTAINNLLAAVE